MSPDHGGMKREMRGNLNLREINLKLHRSAVGKQKGDGAGQHRGGTVMGSSVERGVCRRGEERRLKGSAMGMCGCCDNGLSAAVSSDVA